MLGTGEQKMENLNAENITNEIQSLIKALKECGGWVKRGNGEGWFNHDILVDAVAVITSQEQRIKELTEELDDAKRDTIPKLRLSLERANVMGVEADKKVAELTEENEKLREQNDYLVKEAVFSPMERANNTLEVKADTVRKMHERLKERFSTATRYSKYSGAGVVMVIDQIAKEMLEDE